MAAYAKTRRMALLLSGECSASDTILVQINLIVPQEKHYAWRAQIQDRLNEIAFNVTPMKELRAGALLRKAVDPGTREGAVWAKMRIHRIASDIMLTLIVYRS